MPFYPFLGEVLLLLNRLQKKCSGYPYSNLSTGGPRPGCSDHFEAVPGAPRQEARGKAHARGRRGLARFDGVQQHPLLPAGGGLDPFIHESLQQLG